jgi:hypothetical protein
MTIDKNDTPQKREVIVVLGVGRSGTSLLMQILASLGVGGSKEMMPPNASNPEGFHEDINVVNVHKQLYKDLNASPIIPLTQNWMNEKVTKQALVRLKEITSNELERNKGVWCFKDPRTSTFLPLWIKLFNQLKIVPKFIFAVRKPSSVIQSFKSQYNDDESYSELVYLLRTLDTLHYTGGDCHIIDYDSWFLEPTKTLEGLVSFIFDDENKVFENVELPLKRSLNRSAQSTLKLNNPLVIELYNEIKKSINLNQRSELMCLVARQRELTNSFAPWLTAMRNYKRENLFLNERCNKLKGVWQQVDFLERENVKNCKAKEVQKKSLDELFLAFKANDRISLL